MWKFIWYRSRSFYIYKTNFDRIIFSSTTYLLNEQSLAGVFLNKTERLITSHNYKTQERNEIFLPLML